MILRNTPEGYGLVSRFLHWLIAVAVFVMLGFGLYLEDLKPTLSNLWMFNLHKSAGLTVLALVLLRLVWHRLSPVPLPVGQAGSLQFRLARWLHASIYVLLVAIPLSGWVGASATGIDTGWFGLWTVPAIAPPVKTVENAAFALHGGLWVLLALALVLHVAGAFRHGTGPDGALRRMIRAR